MQGVRLGAFERRIRRRQYRILARTTPLISIVICTRNRVDRLRQCLQAIAGIRSFHAWELVLVDNGSTDATPLLISKFAAAASVPVTVAHQARPGLGRARNTGWRLAKGDIIAFTDDDCYIAPDYIESVAALFSASPRVGFAGGRILLHDPTDYPLTISEALEPRHYPPGSLLVPGEFQGANMIIRRAALETIQGFDDHLGAGTRFVPEDVDALTRASFAGWEGVYDPRPTVRHHHGRKEADIPALKRTYAIGRGAYWAKFALRPDTRRLNLQHWRWRVMKTYKDREHRRVMAQEFSGALAYLLCRVGWSVTARLRQAVSHHPDTRLSK